MKYPIKQLKIHNQNIYPSDLFEFDKVARGLREQYLKFSDSFGSHLDREIRKSLIDHLSNHHIFWKDKDSVYLGCNHAFAESLGMRASDEIIGLTDYDLATTAEQSAQYIKDDQEVMRTGVAKLNIEEHQKMQDGSDKILLTSKMPLYGMGGEILGVLGIYIDITDRILIERALCQAKLNAEQANRAKADFISNISHDIRGPLSIIHSLADKIDASSLDSQSRQYLSWMSESSQSLIKLLNAVIEGVTPDVMSDKLLNETVFDLHQTIADISQLELPGLRLKGLQYREVIDKTIPQYLIGDRYKLMRVLLNIIGNAVKYTHSGQIELNLKCIEENELSFTLSFSIMDTGIGIAHADLDKITQRFFKREDTLTHAISSGVGLDIAYRYVEAMGGQLRFKSELNKGTWVSFDLCFKKSAHPLDASAFTHDNDLDNPWSAFRILVIEDHAIARKLIESLLIKHQCEFKICPNGAEGLLAFNASAYDLIMTDLETPVLTGYELSKRIRSLEMLSGKAPIPIIAVTAHRQEKIMSKAIQSGINEILQKPLMEDDLIALLNKYSLNTVDESM